MTERTPDEPTTRTAPATREAAPPSPAGADDMPVERSSDSDEVEAHPS